MWYPTTAETGSIKSSKRPPSFWGSHPDSETYGSCKRLAEEVGEDEGVEGPLEQLKDDDERLFDDAIEVKDGMREVGGERDPADVSGFPEWYAKFPFLGMRLGRRASFRRLGPVAAGGTKDVNGEKGLGDRNGCRWVEGAETVGRGATVFDVTEREMDDRMKAGWGAGGGTVRVAEYHGSLSITFGLFPACLLQEVSLRTSLAVKSMMKSSRASVTLAGRGVAGLRIQTGAGNVHCPVLQGNGL